LSSHYLIHFWFPFPAAVSNEPVIYEQV